MGLLSVATVEWYDTANRLKQYTLQTFFVHIRSAPLLICHILTSHSTAGQTFVKMQGVIV